MKRAKILLLVMFLFGIASYAQKMISVGGELSVLSLKPNFRMWMSRNIGFEIFGGPSAELNNIQPDDMEAGFKFLRTILYKRTDRTYIGIVGKWKWVNLYDPNRRTSLPIPGLLVGKEWYNKRVHLRGLAIELGYQAGQKEYDVYSPINHFPIGKERFAEFPLILNLRYSFYKRD